MSDAHRIRPMPWLLCAAVLSAASLRAQTGSSKPAIRAAQEGGTILVCRHAITSSFNEREPVDYDDPSTQRRLNEEGERQSRRMGDAMRRLGVRLTDVVASPMHRARRTAELITGRPPRIDSIWHTNGGDYGGEAKEARLRFLAKAVHDGTVLVVSHISTMSSVIPEAKGAVGEGDCVSVRGEGKRHRVVGIVEWREWMREARGRT